MWWLWSSLVSFDRLQDVHQDRGGSFRRMYETSSPQALRRGFEDLSLDTNQNEDKVKYIDGLTLSRKQHYASQDVISSSIGSLPPVKFGDLKYRSSHEIRVKTKRVFEELPANGFLSTYRNPCWIRNDEPADSLSTEDLQLKLECLPYAYILGMPKCGTSDLYERISAHPYIETPKRKEVRWFTRGEFAVKSLPRAGNFPSPYTDTLVDGMTSSSSAVSHGDMLIGPSTSVYSFTSSFEAAKHKIVSNPKIIAVDGGPHTLWWPTQGPDGEFLPEDIPPNQLLREMQPNAKFLITLSDPIKRMYSDYYFLSDNLRPFNPRRKSHDSKSAKQFHDRVKVQIKKFKECVSETSSILKDELARAGAKGSKYLHPSNTAGVSPIWFRASQICAHDRHKFAVGGWGRISIGLYSLFLEKWLEYFPLDQFLVVRLEDYNRDPKGYMMKIFDFLELPSHYNGPDSLEVNIPWDEVLTSKQFNQNKFTKKEPILQETEEMLREFYEPYNEILASMLNDTAFHWKNTYKSKETGQYISLRDKQIEDMNQEDKNEGEEDKTGLVVLDNRDQYRFPQTKAKNLREESEYIDETKQNGIAAAQHGADELDPSHVPLKPRAFSLVGLSMPTVESFGELLLFIDPRLSEWQNAPVPWSGSAESAGSFLCFAAFGLDLYALKYFLYDVGISASVRHKKDYDRTALQCLSLMSSMGDPHPKSQIFALLKGVETFLTPFMGPDFPKQLHSVRARDMLDSLSSHIREVGRWLLRAGIDINVKDSGGNTFLHSASRGGLKSLIELVLSQEERQLTKQEEYDLVNYGNNEGRTALHFAASAGHPEILKILSEHQGDLFKKDLFGVTPWDIVVTPGPISSDDAMKYLNARQLVPKQIHNRKQLHLEHPKGGWDPQRLSGYEDDYECMVDQYMADEVTSDMLFSRYIATNTPVLIRGLLDKWPVNDLYTKQNLTEGFGNLSVDVSDIPYSNKFGGEGVKTMSLEEYIIETTEHHVEGGEYPWYVFRGHPVPTLSESDQSTVKYEVCPTPKVLYEVFKKFYPKEIPDVSDPKSRQLFVNAQWALGGAGTGAPVHFHNTAWSALVFGAKKWFIYAPGESVMSNMQIKQYIETDYKEFEKKGLKARTCVQLAGDVMIIPENWGHGVLNIEESIAIASEVKAAFWRLKPGTIIPNSLPFDNHQMSSKENSGKTERMHQDHEPEKEIPPHQLHALRDKRRKRLHKY